MDEGPETRDGEPRDPGRPPQPGGSPSSSGPHPRLVAALVGGVILVFGLVGWLLLHPRHQAGSVTPGRPEASVLTPTPTVPTEIGVAVTPRLQAVAAGSCRDGTRVFDTRLIFTISPAVV